MDHPFEVGGTYRNRDGSYEVVEISGPKMIIRYEDGRRLETTVRLQARIWEHIQTEEQIRSRRPQPVRGRKPTDVGSTQLGRLVEQNLDDVFIASAFSYVDNALAAIEKPPPEVEAVVGQPSGSSRIVSARKAMHHYRSLTGGQHIPILFTPQTRHEDQVFVYGSRLLDLCYETEIERVRRKVDAGKWLVCDESLYARNTLIIKTPIAELSVKPPIEAATNLLSGPRQGEPIRAIAIPAPKVLDPAFHHLLEDL